MIAGFKRWNAPSGHEGAISRALGEAGLPRISDWISCAVCGFDGKPHLATTEACIAFVHELEREGGMLARRRDYGAAIVRFIRTLAVLNDYTPGVAAIACVLIDAAADCGPDEANLRRANLKKADDLLGMALDELPTSPCIDLLIGRLEAEQGRAESARRWYLRYSLRLQDGTPCEYHRVVDYPHDATEEARFLLYELPKLYRPCVLRCGDSWRWSPWREALAS